MDYSTVVIYHGCCPDGIAAAWAFTQSKNFGKVIYHGTNKRDFFRDSEMPDLTNKSVYIVDYCYPPKTLEAIKEKASFLKVFDHHKSALDKFVVVPDYCIFDTSKCASEMVWEYVHGTTEKPWFLKHIRDRDLWLWEDPNSKAFSQAFFELGICFETLNGLLVADKESMYAKGRELLKIQEEEVSRLCGEARLVDFEGYKVYVLNLASYKSECGAVLSSREECDFAIVYTYNEKSDEWWLSLRGNKTKGIDLLPIAKKYGGGGHPLAAGITHKGNISELFP